MPALQVRDFPPALYEELKAYAAANHRSMAQQTVIAVEEMLATSLTARLDEMGSCDTRDHCVSQRPDADLVARVNAGMFEGYENSALKQARIEKRKQIFEELKTISWGDKTIATEDIVAITREGRDCLSDRVWLSLDPFETKTIDREEDFYDRP